VNSFFSLSSLGAIVAGVMFWQQKEQAKSQCVQREHDMNKFHREEYSSCMRDIYRWNDEHGDKAASRFAELRASVSIIIIIIGR
jgi:hypothetical protein